jgi:hypothetical protein
MTLFSLWAQTQCCPLDLVVDITRLVPAMHRREATQRQTRQFWRRVRWDVAEIRKMVFS